MIRNPTHEMIMLVFVRVCCHSQKLVFKRVEVYFDVNELAFGPFFIQAIILIYK